MIAFFTGRPVLASVLALVLVLFGLVALLVLPVARYPNITPPQVRTSAILTGGDADTVAESVAIPLEQAINGVDDLLYIQSTSGNDGRAVVTATFAVGTDPDLAEVDVLNAVNTARPQLPQTVRDRGVTIETASPQLTAVISLIADAERFDELFVSNYASINIIDRIRRVSGVGRVVNFTRRDYAMRLWLDPQKLEHLALDPVDVIAAVRRQNGPFAGGAVGAAPAPEGQDFALTARAEGQLATVEEFEDIVLLAKPDGTVVTVGDVARVELGAQTYGSAAHFSGEQAAQIGIFQSPDANALELLGAIRAEMEIISQRFPAGIDYAIAFDTTKFVAAAVREVVLALTQAILVVAVVVYVFLQKWRTTVIPSLAIPIALVGAFAFMLVLGFSVNQLTLLGLILAVGLVVDDAIVVVENVERHLADGEDRRTATLTAMREVLAPILATTAVLFALFVPVAFIPGISGRLFNQFSLTVAIAVGLSTLMSLTLTPALARVVLRPPAGEPALPFRWFNRGFDAFSRCYTRTVTRLVGRPGAVAIVMLVVLAATATLFFQRPTGFVPSEDQGYFIVNVQLPEAASFQRTRDVVFSLEEQLLRAPGVADVVAVAGRSFVGNVDAPYFGFLIPIMKNWSARGPDQSVEAVITRLRPELAARQDASIQVFNAPPIPGVGSTGAVRLQFQGFDFQEPEVMARAADAFIQASNERREVGRAFTTFTASVPRLDLDLYRERTERAGVDVGRLFETTQAFLGGAFVNEFTRFGQTYRVFAQAEAEARDEPRDLADLAVRNVAGEMVPLDVLIDAEVATGPQAVSRYNLFPAVEIQAQPAPGISSGALIAAVEATAAERLSGDFGFEWTGGVFQQKRAAGWAPLVFGLAVVFVVLVLAAQFESLAMPLVVALAVPFAVLGAMTGLAIAGLDLDVFGQIGLLMLVGLSAKNAILIVQFARYLQDAGSEPVEAAVEAARLRLRPILMTALSFILGVLPLMLSTGAGANARISLGVTVVGGMTAATVLSPLLVPSLYVMVERVRRRPSGRGCSAEP